MYPVYFCGTQAKLRLEMEMERLRQTNSKDIDSKDEEVEEIRQSFSKKVRRFNGQAQSVHLESFF